MNVSNADFRLKSPEEFFPSPRENHAIETLKRDLRETQQDLLDEGYLREQEDWSFLGNRVVGGEEGEENVSDA